MPQHLNKTSPFVDQNQAYGSNELVGQFLREGDGHGGFSGQLFAGGPRTVESSLQPVPQSSGVDRASLGNNTVFTDPSLPGGSVTFRAVFRRPGDADGVINQTMVPTASHPTSWAGLCAPARYQPLHQYARPLRGRRREG